MSYMKNLAIELHNAGIDYRKVDLAEVEKFKEKFKHQLDQNASIPDIVLTMYGKSILYNKKENK